MTRKLGEGQDGLVWRTAYTAVKCFVNNANYERELECYQHLAQEGITELIGFSIPRLMGYDHELFIVEMDVVNPPRILDFGKAYLKRHPMDRPYPYSDDELKRFLDEKRIQHWDDADWPTIQSVINALDDVGICYFDVKPDNIDVGGLSSK